MRREVTSIQGRWPCAGHSTCPPTPFIGCALKIQKNLEKLDKLDELEKLEKLDGLDKLDELDKLDKLDRLDKLEKLDELDGGSSLQRRRRSLSASYLSPLIFR